MIEEANLQRALLGLGLAAVMLAAAGCAGGSGGGAAAEDYRTVRAEPGRNTDRAKELNEQGLCHLHNGELEEAAMAFRRALTADVEFGPAHNHLGKVYYEQNDLYKAAHEFDEAASLMPKHPAPRNNLGLVHEAAGELSLAVKEYEAAVGLDQDNPEYIGNLVRALIRRGDRTDKVRALLAKLIELDHRREWIQWARAQRSKLGESPR